jgi:hypothetical protein
LCLSVFDITLAVQRLATLHTRESGTIGKGVAGMGTRREREVLVRMSRYFVHAHKSKVTLAAAIAAIGLFAFAAMATTPKAPEFLPLHVHVGEKAPDFALPSTDGSRVRLSQFAGHNVLLNFYEGYW